MIAVKFDHSVKYNGIRYGAHEVFSVEDKDIEALKNAGAVVVSIKAGTMSECESVVDTVAHSDDDKLRENNTAETVEDVISLKEELITYNVGQLKEFAQERNINLEGKTKKADIYNAIVATLN